MAGGADVPLARQGVVQMAARTQEQFSFKSSLSRPYISQLERNHKSPTVDTLFRICDALEVSAVNIIKRVDSARKRKAGP
jgi:transcriptional regulator with XRE-family HTH domain